MCAHRGFDTGQGREWRIVSVSHLPPMGALLVRGSRRQPAWSISYAQDLISTWVEYVLVAGARSGSGPRLPGSCIHELFFCVCGSGVTRPRGFGLGLRLWNQVRYSNPVCGSFPIPLLLFGRSMGRAHCPVVSPPGLSQGDKETYTKSALLSSGRCVIH